jgi:hypothetical protein
MTVMILPRASNLMTQGLLLIVIGITFEFDSAKDVNKS